MKELTQQDVEMVSGGNPFLIVLGAAMLIYAAGDAMYQFGEGFSDGYNGK